MTEKDSFYTPFSSKKQTAFIILAIFVYSISYLARYSYNSNINLIMSDYGCDHVTSGTVTTFFYLAYGIGQLLHGIFCKHYNQKYTIPFALLLSSVINVPMYFKLLPFGYVKYLWFINGLLQSVLWPSVVYITSLYLDDKHIKLSVVLYSITTTLGIFFSYGTSALCVSFGNYRNSFLFGATVPIIAGIGWILFFGNTKLKHSVISDSEAKEEKKKISISKSLFVGVIVLIIFAMVNSFIKDGIQTWIPAILKETFNIKDDISIILSLTLPLVGTVGSFLAIYTNKIIKDLPLLASFFFLIGAICLIFIITLKINPFIFLSLIGLVFLFMNSVNNVISSIAPLVYRKSINSGTLAGILNGACYLGSTVSSITLGKIADSSGWDTAYVVLFIVLIIASIIGLGSFIIRNKIIRN